MPPRPNLIRYNSRLSNGNFCTIYCLRYHRKAFECREQLIKYWSTKVNPSDMEEMIEFNNLVLEVIKIK